MSRLRPGFARWRSDVPSGGNRYDDELATGLRGLGVDVREYAVVGSWPVVDEAEQRGFAERLTTERAWLVDNILAAGAPQAIAAARATGRRVAVLVHYFPADEIGWTAAERDRITTAEAARADRGERDRHHQPLDRGPGRGSLRPFRRGGGRSGRAPGSARTRLRDRPARRGCSGWVASPGPRTRSPLLTRLTRLGDLDWTAQRGRPGRDRPGLHRAAPRRRASRRVSPTGSS